MECPICKGPSICYIGSKKRMEVGSVRDILCACEQQQATIPSMFSVCNVDYIVYISSSNGIAREHFGFLEHRF